MSAPKGSLHKGDDVMFNHDVIVIIPVMGVSVSIAADQKKGPLMHNLLQFCECFSTLNSMHLSLIKKNVIQHLHHPCEKVIAPPDPLTLPKLSD